MGLVSISPVRCRVAKIVRDNFIQVEAGGKGTREWAAPLPGKKFLKTALKVDSPKNKLFPTMSHRQFARAPVASKWEQFAHEQYPEYEYDDDADCDVDYEEDGDVDSYELEELIAMHQAQMNHALKQSRRAARGAYSRQDVIAGLRAAVLAHMASHIRDARQGAFEQKALSRRAPSSRGRSVVPWRQEEPKVLYDVVDYDRDNNVIYLRERLDGDDEYAETMAIKRKKGSWMDRFDRPENPATAWLTPAERLRVKKQQRFATIVQMLTTGGLALAGFGVGGPLGAAVGGAAGSMVGEVIAPTPGKRWTAERAFKKAGTAAVVSGLAPLVFYGIPATAATIGGLGAGYYESSR